MIIQSKSRVGLQVYNVQSVLTFNLLLQLLYFTL